MDSNSENVIIQAYNILSKSLSSKMNKAERDSYEKKLKEISKLK